MSDDENYSDSNSENSDSENEEVVETIKKPLFKPSAKVLNNNFTNDEEDEDSDSSSSSDEEEEEIEDDDNQDGGALDDSEEEVEEDDEESDIELDEDGEPIIKESEKANSKPNKTAKNSKIKKPQFIVEDEEDDEDEFDENYLQKFDNDLIKNYVNEFHPECLNNNYDEINMLSVVVRNPDGIIVDPLHKTIPYLTKYEKTRVLGQRSKQIENGGKPFVKVPENIVDSYIIAELELKEKKIPFIIRRPIPGGGSEYWRLKDLEVIAF
jgi:DNA-directed RNA polymerase I, II, and III subunit RPABC2